MCCKAYLYLLTRLAGRFAFKTTVDPSVFVFGYTLPLYPQNINNMPGYRDQPTMCHNNQLFENMTVLLHPPSKCRFRIVGRY